MKNVYFISVTGGKFERVPDDVHAAAEKYAKVNIIITKLA